MDSGYIMGFAVLIFGGILWITKILREIQAVLYLINTNLWELRSGKDRNHPI